MSIDRIRNEWYPAWDAGDAGRFVTVTRDVFAPDAAISPKPGMAPVALEELIPGWLGELAAWSPQHHEVVLAVEAGGETAWTMRWTATHAGPLTLPGGRVVPATGRTVEAEAAFFAGWDAGRIVRFSAFSDYHGLVAQLERLG